MRDDCRISQTAEGEARSLYVELEAAHEELLVRAQETEAECRRWREGDERKKHRRERARLENERDALRDENDALRVCFPASAWCLRATHRPSARRRRRDPPNAIEAS